VDHLDSSCFNAYDFVRERYLPQGTILLSVLFIYMSHQFSIVRVMY
jgi:hypothetical protein